MIRIKITLLLIALLSGKYKIPHFFFIPYNICTLLNRQLKWKKKEISNRARGSWSVHHTLEELDNGCLFLWLGLSSTRMRHKNEAFRKRSSNQRNMKTPASRFAVDSSFENEEVTITIIFPCPTFTQIQIQDDR